MVLIDYDGLRERGIRYSRAHLWRLSIAGKFPKPIKLSPSRNAWLESAVDAWIESRVAERGVCQLPSADGPQA
jgi:prophage regulatory protein